MDSYYILWSSSSRCLQRHVFADESEMVIWNPTVCWLQLCMFFLDQEYGLSYLVMYDVLADQEYGGFKRVPELGMTV